MWYGILWEGGEASYTWGLIDVVQCSGEQSGMIENIFHTIELPATVSYSPLASYSAERMGGHDRRTGEISTLLCSDV